MAGERLPVAVSGYGPHRLLAWNLHALASHGDHVGTLNEAGRVEGLTAALGDGRTFRMARLARMYALIETGRLDEALVIGEELLQPWPDAVPRATQAKIMADTAEVLLRLGRIDEGLHHLAGAVIELETLPRDSRYSGVLSSICEAALGIELYEFADDCFRVGIEAVIGTAYEEIFRLPAEMQQAELRLEWALRLEQVGRFEEANALFTSCAERIGRWDGEASGLGRALLAVACAKIGRQDEAAKTVAELLLPMRENGQNHEARLLHLAYGLVKKAECDLAGARREFLAADELATEPGQRLIFRHELAVLAADESPGQASATLLTAIKTQADVLWRQRLDRRMMLRQACRRVELELARAAADRAAMSDALTGLGNRRMFDQRMSAAGASGALLLIDVDKFKGINDEFSHGVGDRVLAEIAAVLRAHCRHDEVAIRFGGDEFAIFLTTTPADGARVAERIRRTIDSWDWSTVATGLSVTLSMGLAAYERGMSGKELYDRADAHLYRAKRGGRNQLGLEEGLELHH
jgi:diguanylate cyclase